MRRKQFFALLLAGMLTVGMVPSAAFAAEGGDNLEMSASADGGEGEATGDEGGETGDPGAEAPEEPSAPEITETPAESPTEAPAEPPTETPTEAPVETPTEAPAEPPTEAPAEETPAPEEGDVPAAAVAEPTPTVTEAPQNGTAAGTLEELKAAIAAAPAAADESDIYQIKVSGTFDMDAPLDIPEGKNIALVSTAADTEFTRAHGFLGDMFTVSGGALYFTVDNTDAEGASLTVDGAHTDPTKAEGSIVNVSSGTFTMADGVTLQNNVTSAQGAAIHNTAGNVSLQGGSITGNQSEDGALYSEGIVAVQGGIAFSANTPDGVNAMDVVLSGASAVINVAGALGDEVKISVSVKDAAAGAQVVSIPQEVIDAGVTMEDVLKKITYAGTGFKIGDDGKLAADVTVTPTNTPAPAITPSLTIKSGTAWTSHTSATVKAVSKSDGWYYYKCVEAGADEPKFDFNKDGSAITGGKEFSIFLNDMEEEKGYDVYVSVKDKAGQISVKKLIQFRDTQPNKRPTAAVETPTPTPVHDAVVPKVEESIVQGFDEPLEFWPGVFYEFKVIGAGTTNTNPGEGDVKWVPLYWSTLKNPSDSGKHTTWSIGHKNGIEVAAAYNIYIFFQKWIYQDGEWSALDIVESAAYQFRSAEITISGAPVSPTVTGQAGNGGGGGNIADGETSSAVTPKAGTLSDTSKKGSVSTADESPVGTMILLAAVSLLAGGYILVRKRKKVTE